MTLDSRFPGGYELLIWQNKVSSKAAFASRCLMGQRHFLLLDKFNHAEP